MSEVNPAPVKGGNASNRQKLMLAILATILVAVLIVFLLPTLTGGGDDDTDTSTPAPTATSVPATGTPTPGSTPAAGGEGGEQASEPIARPTRDPFAPAPGFGQ